MPNINPDQFDNYKFETVYEPEMNTTTVRASVYGHHSGAKWLEPTASMRISGYQRESNRYEQELINQGRSHHGIGVDDSGQMKWTGGMMNDSVDKVSWLGMNKEGLSPKEQSNILKGMFGTAVQTHGSIPHADDELSIEGSRIAQAMHRRYGLKPHPKNPKMLRTPSLGWLDEAGDSAVQFSISEASDLINNSRSGVYKDYSNEEVADSVQWLQGMAEQHKPKKKKKKTDDIPLPGMGD
jgi:hypothetical protein